VELDGAGRCRYALLGIAALARPTALLVPWWRCSRLGRHAGQACAARQLGALLACAAAVLVFVLPVVVRNARLDRVAITTNGGVNFYAGNSPGATGRFHEPPGVQFFRSPMLVAAPPGSSLPPDVARRALTVRAAAGNDEAADSALWMHRARTWIAAQPAAFVTLQFRKLRWLLQASEGAQIESWAFQRQRIGLLRLFIVDFGWIWPLAAFGIWQAWRVRRRGAWVVGGFALALLLPAWCLRQRALPLGSGAAAVLGGRGAATLIDWIRARRVRQASIAGGDRCLTPPAGSVPTTTRLSAGSRCRWRIVCGRRSRRRDRIADRGRA
jgi:hypothetical protein